MLSHSFRKSTAAALALGLCSTGVAYAHLPSSALEGSAPPGDSVSLRNIDTDHHLQSLVAKNGRFHFRRLPIGIYEVVIHHQDGSSDAPILARARLGETVQVNRKDRLAWAPRSADTLVTLAEQDQANGSRSTIVASRSGPVETIASGQPDNSSSARK
jgi:hypothetical protein